MGKYLHPTLCNAKTLLIKLKHVSKEAPGLNVNQGVCVIAARRFSIVAFIDARDWHVFS